MGKPLSSEQIFQIGFACGIGGLILFLLLHGYKRKKPDLAQSINVLISTGGLFYGIELVRVIFFAKPGDLGIPVHYKVPMLIGAIVMIWRSVEGDLKLFHPIFTARRHESPQDSTL